MWVISQWMLSGDRWWYSVALLFKFLAWRLLFLIQVES
jgi:hypothetical protein